MIGDDNKLDKMLKNRLEQYMPEPSPEIWENIRKGVAAQQRPRRLFYYRLIPAAAVLLFALITGVLVRNNLENHTPVVAEKQKNQGGTPAAAGEKEIPEISPLSALAVNAPPYVKAETGQGRPSATAETEKLREPAPEPVQERLLFSMAEMRSLPPFLPVMPVENGPALPEINKSVTFSVQEKPDQPQWSSAPVKKKPREGRNWEIGLHLTPDYSSYSASHTSAYARNMTFPAEQTRAGLGGGISIKYAASGKWRIESGLYYSRAGDVSGNKNPGNASQADNFTISAMADKHNVTAVTVDNGHVAINSTAGVINFSQSVNNAGIFSLSENAINLNTALLSSGTFAQVFDFMEIPLDFRYRILNKTVGIELIGGISTSLVVGNNVYWEQPSGREKVGTTGDISPVNFAGVAGIGTTCALGKNLSLSVEPRASYFLHSINHSGDVSFKPWRIGMFTGVTYRF